MWLMTTCRLLVRRIIGITLMNLLVLFSRLWPLLLMLNIGVVLNSRLGVLRLLNVLLIWTLAILMISPIVLMLRLKVNSLALSMVVRFRMWMRVALSVFLGCSLLVLLVFRMTGNLLMLMTLMFCVRSLWFVC